MGDRARHHSLIRPGEDTVSELEKHAVGEAEFGGGAAGGGSRLLERESPTVEHVVDRDPLLGATSSRIHGRNVGWQTTRHSHASGEVRAHQRKQFVV